MLKQIMALLFVLSAAGCSPVLQMTRKNAANKRKLSGAFGLFGRRCAPWRRLIGRSGGSGCRECLSDLTIRGRWAKTLKCVMWKFISFPRRYVRLWQMPRRERPKCWLTAACGEFARKMRVFAGFYQISGIQPGRISA